VATLFDSVITLCSSAGFPLVLPTPPPRLAARSREKHCCRSAGIFLYLWNLIAAVVLGGFGNPVFQLVILMLLFANVRATIL
jgi:hypothetical protein